MKTSPSRFPVVSAGQFASARLMNVSCFLLRSKNARPRFWTSGVSGYTLLVTDRAGGGGVEAMDIMTEKAQKSRWTAFTSVGSIQTCGSAGLVKRSPVPLAAGGGLSGMAWGDFSSLVEHADKFSTVFQLSCIMWGPVGHIPSFTLPLYFFFFVAIRIGYTKAICLSVLGRVPDLI